MNKYIKGILGVALAFAGSFAFANEWTYKPVSGDTPATISDGTWSLKVEVVDATKHTLCLGLSTAGNANAIAVQPAKAAVVDLRGTITDSEETTWTLVKISGRALGENKIISGLYTPGTLGENAFYGQNLRAATSLSTLVIDEPTMTGIFVNNYVISVPASTVTIKAPHLLTIGGSSGAFNRDWLSNTDVTDWDLSGVKYFVDSGYNWASGAPTASNADPWFFHGRKFTGVLKLPALTSALASTFSNCVNMTGLEIGTDNQLTALGADVATDCHSLVRVVLGGKEGWTLGARAFKSANITNVVFVGTMPTILSPNEVAFGTSSTAARTILFEVPRNDATWADVIAAARAATDDELAEFDARYGADRRASLIGILPPNMLKTANAQYLAYGADSTRTYTISFTLDAKHPEQAVVVTPQKDAYTPGETVTIAPAKGQEVYYWWGNVPKANRRDASLTLKIDANLSIRPLFRNKWTVTVPEEYEANTAVTMTDGNWTFNARVIDPVKRTLSMGTRVASAAGNVYASGNTGSGVINLLGTYTDGAGQEWTVTDLGTWKTFAANSGPTAFYAPETVVWSDQSLRACKTLNTFALVSTNAVGVIGNNNFYDNGLDANLVNMLLAAPGLTGLGFNAANSSFISSSDVSNWDLSGLKGIGVNYPLTDTNGGDFFKGKSFSGVLDLPALVRLNPWTLSNTKKMTGVKLGADGVLATIGAGAVSNSAALVSAEIAGAKGLTIAGGAFYSPKLREVKFTSYRPTLTSTDVTFGTDDTEALSMVFRVSNARHSSWASTIQLARAATDEERARFRLLFGEDTYLVGVVPTTAFCTAQEQYLVVGGPDDPPNGLFFSVH